MDSHIAVVVVSHCSLETIDECLARLLAADGVAAVSVVDNASGDGTMQVVQRHAVADPRVRFIANPDNPGFAMACNQGVAELRARGCAAGWLAFVNPDCLVEPGSLARLRAHASSSGHPLLVGADLVDDSGTRDGAARRRDPDFGRMLASLWRGRRALRLEVAPDPGAALQPVDAVSGALMVMPCALFDQVGGFDSGYRLHAEDLDLCRRVRSAGAAVAVANDVRVVHIRGVSSRARPVFVEWHKHRGLWRYFRKFEAPRRNRLTCALVFLAIWSRFPFAALKGIFSKAPSGSGT
ncbi:MAG TPA: glycosyltransferase family 2 protein [Xanthomonadaceae bacterium]|nr:glycosyltransferase family 2 protein [Xanthomonadaceae bacterium]